MIKYFHDALHEIFAYFAAHLMGLEVLLSRLRGQVAAVEQLPA